MSLLLDYSLLFLVLNDELIAIIKKKSIFRSHIFSFFSACQCKFLTLLFFIILQTKKEEHMLKRRNVPTLDSTDSEDNEKPTTQSLETIVANANSTEPEVQLGAVQAARLVVECKLLILYFWLSNMKIFKGICGYFFYMYSI